MKTSITLLFGLFINFSFGQEILNNNMVDNTSVEPVTQTEVTVNNVLENEDFSETETEDFSGVIRLFNAIELTDNDGKVLIATQEKPAKKPIKNQTNR